MAERAPIHAGSGEPVLLLHPFLLSQSVWKYVAPQLARTGRYEVFAPTMAGHHGGAHAPFLLDVAALADDVERRLDELGWTTAHIVGNSLGGWVAFELERRGRARTLTGIAPAGGWSMFTLAKYEVIAKFMAALPVVLTTTVLRQQVLKLPLSQRISYLAVSATPDALNASDRHDLIDDVAHCPAYFKLMVKALTTAGLTEIGDSHTPTHLVLCEKDRVLPAPRFSRHFTASLAPDAVITTLNGVGHVPMFEAPDTITRLISEFVDGHIDPARATG
ncbi:MULTISPECIES: alpha/beta fold hydrolase [unclassified Mycolicibacterium]|uniref:alpha/beta fold hydrolase n=1 Tax=unclassified Mycolicibacterium TaxID=2636767 RepID=UPI0012DEC9EB|nr:MULTISPECIES: alpha/beta hydrolase [unclassified Mycolicibacterium]MUL81171.1 alpha/beta hydrolase [Mycolicibacterium sp. CBMA 329]MUL86937.1 alpha/beta hydrolase [Mycolicibacterium sp. CBMA 331]MUL98779.1 alpha/beta hydrolase [Mycolicibacterium sp. CBMA 334]MUM25639.1 alpha/beta hydrolase [Mycolicibacterium sp. CBMA 295]MUM37234.1 alpha/beta hydrolase [Mycolicibacterium sp. CBMA 247]